MSEVSETREISDNQKREARFRRALLERSFLEHRKLDPSVLEERIRQMRAIAGGKEVKAVPKKARASSLVLPAVTTPEELAEHCGWSSRRVRAIAKKLGACSSMGGHMVLTQADVVTIMELQRCPSNSTLAAKAKFGTTAARLPAGGYEDLVKQRTKASRRVRLPRSKPANGNVISMDRKRS